VRAWQHLDQFHCEADDKQALAQFRAWMGQMVRRLGLNAVRFRTAQRRQPAKKLLRFSPPDADDSAGHAGSLNPPAGGSTPSSHVRQGEEGTLLHEALENIPEVMDRLIIRLRFYEGLSLRQIAEQLQVSPDKVRERFHFTLRRLERDLKGLA
jgi:RNA polymerase sigma factor (sigma-70 family)